MIDSSWIVIPAKAGAQLGEMRKKKLGPRFRGDDEEVDHPQLITL
jgi:hypothetical protein